MDPQLTPDKLALVFLIGVAMGTTYETEPHYTFTHSEHLVIVTKL